MSRRNLYWLLGIMFVSLLGLAVSYSAPTREKNENYELVRLFVDVLQEVDQKYVVDLDPERKRKLAEDMINGGLERLDPHSSYINPREYKQFNKQSKGKFGGIGVQVGYDRQNRGQLTVISPMPGTPAYEAGILAGDSIVKIDGKTHREHAPQRGRRSDPGRSGSEGYPDCYPRGPARTARRRYHPRRNPRPERHGRQTQVDDPKEWDFLYDKQNKIGYLRLSSSARRPRPR